MCEDVGDREDLMAEREWGKRDETKRGREIGNKDKDQRLLAVTDDMYHHLGYQNTHSASDLVHELCLEVRAHIFVEIDRYVNNCVSVNMCLPLCL